MTQLENDFLKSLMESDREVSSRSNQAVIKEKKTIKDFRRDFLAYMKTLSQDKELDKAVSDFASGYDAKDDKLDLMGWDILNSDKRARKYVSLEDVERLSEHPSTLRRAVFKRSFLNYIECGKMEFCALQGEELIEYLMDEVFQNPDLLKKNCYVPRPDGTVGSAYADWDRCRFSSTPDAIRAKFNALVGGDSSVSVITYYGIHGVHLDIEELKTAFNRSVKEQCTVVTEGNVTGFIQDKTLSDLCSLRKLLKELEQNGRLHIYTGLAGCGKAQPVDTIIPTPDGDKLLGDLVVGDYVFDRYGNPTKVLGIFDHDSKPCYELTFSDGRVTRCCDEHLWTVFTSRGNLKTFMLRDMISKGLTAGKKPTARFRVPVNGMVQYRQQSLPVHPYVVGAFLGDGCCLENTLTLSSNDLFVVEKIAGLLGCTYRKRSEHNYSWAFYKNGLPVRTKELFKEVPELLSYSRDKNIPQVYLHTSSEDRLDLLRGLLDTDGSVSARSNGCISWSTSSYRLYQSFARLARSLGLCVSTRTKMQVRERADGRGTKSPEYTVHITVVPERFSECVSLPRHLEKLQSVWGTYKTPAKLMDRVALVSVRKLDDCQQRCIEVDNAEHLYLTNDFIVTHNTHRAIAECFPERFNNGRTLMISLSTLVAINGSQRANAFEEIDHEGHKLPSPRPTTPCSITMFNLCKNTSRMRRWVDNYNTYCIDELSQWGLEHLNTLISIAELAKSNQATLVIMGDVNQIGSFLGRGNLLYMLSHNFPVTELKENHRADSGELIDFVWGLQKTRRRDFAKWTLGTQELVEYVHRKPFPVNDSMESHEDDFNRTEMAVTGSNSCAGLINMLRLEAALKTSDSDTLPSFYLPSRGDWNYYSMWNDNQEWIRRRMSMTSVRVRPLENFKFGKGSSKSLEETYAKKFLRNEACVARMTSEWRVKIVSEVLPANLACKTESPEMKCATISWNEFITHFAPNYATTVNKAQGLEWNDVLVVYGDVGKLDSRQGEFVPSKNYNLNGNNASQATYVALSRARTSLSIYTGGVSYGRQEEPMFADHLECLKEVDGYGADAVETEESC